MGTEPHILFVLMVKNESAILERCLLAAEPFVDAVLVFDTGSTDATLDVARNYTGRPLATAQEPWLDFGRSRTASLKAARRYAAVELGWQLRHTYALVLDADMRLQGVPTAFRTYMKSALASDISAVALTQKLGNISYHNTRLLRLVDGWFCKGATHEYWTGGRERTSLLDEHTTWIQDVGDGGCKEDKFERDAKLLRRTLEDEPEDARTLFYLAQTYHDWDKPREALAWYARRIAAGGWLEEVWYSHYKSATCHVRLGEYGEAEQWVKKALKLCADRAEPATFLATALREEGMRRWQACAAPAGEPPPDIVSLFNKAWRLLERVAALPVPAATRLFVEPSAYGPDQWLEKTYLAYYMAPDEPALGLEAGQHCEGPKEAQALLNTLYYTKPLPQVAWHRLAVPSPPGYATSSVGVADGVLCVRCVNYIILPDGGYLMPDGFVDTRNFLTRWKGVDALTYEEAELAELTPAAEAPRRPDSIRGLEDVRLCGTTFTATTREFSYGPFNRMVWGTYAYVAGEPTATARFTAMLPPGSEETSCEKNWIPLDARHCIYRWHPLEIYAVQAPRLELVVTHATPAWFRHVRGSTPFVEIDGQLWGLVHVVVPRTPRVYLHCFVWLEPTTWRLTAYSLPFVLKRVGIEYTLGLAHAAATAERPARLQIFASLNDCESWVGEVELGTCKKLARPWAAEP
jgi:tetratricopeptide (TPR) repeat protein